MRRAAVMMSGAAFAAPATFAAIGGAAAAEPDLTVGVVADVNPTPTNYAQIDNLTDFNGTLFFGADDRAHGPELWRSDGSPGGTRMVADIWPGSGYGDETNYAKPRELTPIGQTLFFTHDDFQHGREVWKTDGTTRGTSMVADIGQGRRLSSFPRNLTVMGERLYFTADDRTGDDFLSNTSVWTSDGTRAGTFPISDPDEVDPRAFSGVPMAVVDGNLFFLGEQEGTGLELWKSNGTVEGTEMVLDIQPGPGSSYPSELTADNGKIYFTADDGTHGEELWRSDGTSAGTQLVSDIESGADGSDPSRLTMSGEDLYFTSYTDAFGSELWRSKGDAASTVVVRDIRGGRANSSPRGLTPSGNNLFFTAETPARGRELWIVAPAPTGARLVADINPGTAESGIYQLADVGGTLFFSADDGTHGKELWSSDGTAATTGIVQDIAPGTEASNPYDFAVVGPRLFFSATDGVAGSALWSATPSEYVVTSQSKPLVTGTARVGSVLAGDPGMWTPDGLTYSYEWLIATTGEQVGTRQRLTVPAKAAGQRLILRVVATRASGGSATAESVRTAAVALGTLTIATRPAVSGTPTVGSVLTADPGGTSPAATRSTISWLRNGQAVAGATGREYQVTEADRGARIAARVVFERTGYRPLTSTSPQTPLIR